jgi:hypothetical protein
MESPLNSPAENPGLSDRVRTESAVRIEISVIIDTEDPWEAQAQAAAAMRDAFESTVPSIAGMTHDLVLQAA